MPVMNGYQAVQELRQIPELKNVPIIGDALRDLRVADAIGALPILLLTGKGKITQEQNELPPHTLIFDDLCAAVDAIVGHA